MKKCFLDMDGVLCDWVGAACEFLGVQSPYKTNPAVCGQWDLLQHLGMTPKQKDAFWDNINHAEFWADLEIMPEAHAIVDLLNDYFGRHNVCILSSPGHMEYCMPGKVRWLREHFPKFANNNQYLFGKGKEFCAHPGMVLIDDFNRNVDAFREHGGIAFLVPRPWNPDFAKEPQLLDNLSLFLDTL